MGEEHNYIYTLCAHDEARNAAHRTAARTRSGPCAYTRTHPTHICVVGVPALRVLGASRAMYMVACALLLPWGPHLLLLGPTTATLMMLTLL